MTTPRHIPTASPLAAILFTLALGCNSIPAGIPKKSTTLVATQPGSLPRGFGYISTSREEGTVYLFDDTSDRIIYTSSVAFGDKLVFDPRQKQVLFNGNPISQPDLNEKHVYRLYFHRKDEPQSK